MKKSLFLIVLPVLLYQGCMMAGMGMMGMDHSKSSDAELVKVIVKEVSNEKYTFAVEFAAPLLHNRVNYLLQIHDTQTGKKITQAEVQFEVFDLGFRTANASENLIQAKAEPDNTGNFTASYTFHSENEVSLGFRVISVENIKIPKPIEISTIQKPVGTHDEHSSGSGINAFWMVGAGVVMMAVMMYVVRI